MARYKLSRKDIRQPDEFISTTRRVLDYLQAHRRQAILTSTAVLSLLLLVAGWWSYSAWGRRASAAALSEGIRAHRQGNCGQALVPLRRAASWRRTPSGALARLYLGDCLWRTTRYADAADVFGELHRLSSAPEIRQLALVRRGAARLALDELDDARQDFTAALELTGPYEPDALWGLATAQERAGDADAAATTYRRLADLGDQSPLVGLGRTKADNLTADKAAPAAG